MKKNFTEKLQFSFSSQMRSDMDKICSDREISYGSLIRWLIQQEILKDKEQKLEKY